jgi:hypothetical protein
MRVKIKIGETTYEVDNPRLAAALRNCETEAEAERAIQQALKRRRKKRWTSALTESN